MSTTPNSALYVDPSTGALSTGAVQFRNRIINGDMRIDQRLAGAANASLATGSDTYTADRWAAWRNTAGNYTVQRVSNATVPGIPGNVYALQATVTTATSPVSTDTYFLHQKIEGFNVADFGLGTASAATFTVSFYVKSSVTGTYSFVCHNSARNRSYVTTYVVSAANTWEYKTITIQGDTAGTWLKDTSTGLDCMWTLGYGVSAGTATGNTWLASSAYGLTGSTQWINNASATFAISNVQVERGSTATPFEVRPYAMELGMCMRYYGKSYDTNTIPGTAISAGLAQINGSNTDLYINISFKKPMNATPSIYIYDHLGVSNQVTTNSATKTPRVLYISTGGFLGGSNQASLTFVGFHWVASAEL